MVEHLRLISASTVAEILQYDDLIPTMEKALAKFSCRPDSGVIQPVRTVLRVPPVDGFLGVMPAYSEMDDILSTKLVAFFPRNKGIPSHNAVIMLFNSHTGIPQALLDGDVITARRTAAASAAATKHLVSGVPQQLAILGAGVQARSHYYALSSQFNFQQVRIWNHNPDKAKALAAELGPEVEAVAEASEAVQNADLIVTVTSSSTPVVQADWVKPGAHINAVGACRPDWCEIAPELMQKSAVYVDSKEAAIKESGDIIKSGASIAAEIGEVIAGKAEVRRSDTTIFVSLGMAIEDAAAANLVLKRLAERDNTN
ncbi:hypothetical protein BaRGS_00001496 [Batillaria attramentaria]|uniref:Ketimine reductase mu-crystallin n=1 Tax=Batillaria attramentaria TaxID=370345 RepID=A0ABD0M860_9CAEN